MSVTVQQVDEWLRAKEGEAFEFKEAKQNFHFEKLAKYCCALANAGGGEVVLGVTDRRPRRVVGSQAFDQPERTCRGLRERLPLRIDFDEVTHPGGRVLLFHVPPRPIGTPIKFEGVYWTRDGDDLVPMSEDQLRAIFAESGHDFSGDICPKVSIDDLDPVAIDDFRRRWIGKVNRSGDTKLARQLITLSPGQLLADAGVMEGGKVTFAGLILFGTRRALGRHLPQAEVVFEYRSSEASGPAQDRREYRQGFFSYYDDLWTVINLRNDKQHYQDGLFVLDVPTFSERPVREALLNAISHRDYQLGGSVFVRQFVRRLEIDSPGGLPVGITLDNILDRQSPRNRRIADVFTRCGLVERSGQGMNLIFEEAIRQSKPVPDFARTDRYQVGLALYGTVQDPNFIRFLEKVGQEARYDFTTHDLLVLDQVSRTGKVAEALKPRVEQLLDKGVIERVSRGRGTRYLLSRRYHAFIGQKGAYTRKRGLDRPTNKGLLLKHIEDHAEDGSPIRDLLDVLPNLSRGQVKTLLQELKDEEKIHCVGTTIRALWYPGRGTG